MAFSSFDLSIIFLQLKYMGFIIFNLFKKEFSVGNVGCSSFL